MFNNRTFSGVVDPTRDVAYREENGESPSIVSVLCHSWMDDSVPAFGECELIAIDLIASRPDTSDASTGLHVFSYLALF